MQLGKRRKEKLWNSCSVSEPFALGKGERADFN